MTDEATAIVYPETYGMPISDGEFQAPLRRTIVEPLLGEKLVDSEYRRIELAQGNDGQVWDRSELLDIGLRWVDGGLGFSDSVTGERLISPEKAEDALIETEDRATEAEGRTNSERVA